MEWIYFLAESPKTAITAGYLDSVSSTGYKFKLIIGGKRTKLQEEIVCAFAECNIAPTSLPKNPVEIKYIKKSLKVTVNEENLAAAIIVQAAARH